MSIFTENNDSLKGEVRLAEIDEVIPWPICQRKFQVLHWPEEHLEKRGSAPDGGHPPRGEVDVGIVGEFLSELPVKVVGPLCMCVSGQVIDSEYLYTMYMKVYSKQLTDGFTSSFGGMWLAPLADTYGSYHKLINLDMAVPYQLHLIALSLVVTFL